MELKRLNTETLNTGQNTYDFDDCAIELEDGKTITVDGYAEIDFTFENVGILEEERINYEIDDCEVNISSVWDYEGEATYLTCEEMSLVQTEIENTLRSQTVENN